MHGEIELIQSPLILGNTPRGLCYLVVCYSALQCGVTGANTVAVTYTRLESCPPRF